MIQRSLLARFLAFALMVVACPAFTAPAKPFDVELLESTTTQIRFRVRFVPPSWREHEVQGTRGQYPLWTGLDRVAEPNDPDIGVALVRVALPSRGQVTLVENPQNGGRADGVVFPTAEPGSQDVSAARAPLHHARILKLGVERGLRTALVAVYPVRQTEDDPNDVFWTESIEVTLRIDGPHEVSRNAPRADHTWDNSLLNPESVPLFVSSVQSSAAMPSVWFDDGGGWLKIQVAANGIYTLSRDSLAQAGVPVSTLDPQTLRLFSGPLVPELAWTTLGWRDSVDAGDTTQVSNWYHVNERPGFTTGFGEPGGMEEVDIWVDGDGDVSFEASDRVVFYGLGPDNYRDRFSLPPGGEEYFLNPYSDHTVYWLTWGGTFPDSPHRMATVDATPSGGTPITESAARVHAEQNTIYAPALIEGGLRWEMWFWDILSSQSSFYRALVTLPGLVAGSQMSGNIRLWGASEPEGNGNEDLHNVQVDVNSVSQGTFQWGGPTVYEDYSPKDIAFSNVNSATPARIEFRVPSIVVGRFDLQYLAWIDVHYRRILALGSQPGELEVEAGAADRVIHIAQVPTGTLDVFDVTSFRHPKRLTGWVSAPTVSGPGIDFAVATPGNMVVSIASRSIPKAPRSIAMDDAPGSWLRDVSQGLDHITIAHDDFMSEAEELAARRRAFIPYVSAPRARAVRVSDVMDEFAWGMWDPLAIRYFLEYVYEYYGTGTDPLSYAVFLGDHTYDFRNYLGTGTRDLVPSWEDNHDDLARIRTGSTQYASDDPFVLFDGPQDVFVDVATGRIPVSTVSGARAVIEDKILRSEVSPEFGSWRARAVIATDDLCQFGNVDPVGQDVLNAAEDVDQLLPPAFDRAKVYMTEYGTACTITSKPEASDDFIDLWNSGAWLVNYLGHGTETFLSDERLLSSGDVPSLTNLDRLPLFIATASKSAKFNLPNQTSITESVAISPVGGALAATGSVSDHTISTTAFQLNWNFVSRLFLYNPACLGCPPDLVPAGLAFAQSKGFAGDDTKKYVFFGDPASLPPAARLGNLSLTLAGPDTLVRGALASLGASLQSPDPAAAFDEWLLEIRAEDAREPRPLGYALPGDLMFRGDSRFASDSLSAGFVVPLAAREGPDARIRGYAWTDGGDALAAITPLPIAGSVDPASDIQGPIITFEAHPPEMTAGQTVGVVIEDPSGILLVNSGEPALVLVVLDAQNAEVLRLPLSEDFAYDIGQHTRGTVRFAIPEGLENGTYTFRVSAADNFGNPTAATTTVQISSGGNGVSFTSVYAYPNPLTTDTDVVFTLDRDVQVTLRIYSVSGRLVQHATLSGAPGQNGYHWNGRDQAGDPVANGVYLLQLSAPGSDEPVKHMERLVVLR